MRKTSPNQVARALPQGGAGIMDEDVRMLCEAVINSFKGRKDDEGGGKWGGGGIYLKKRKEYLNVSS